MIRRVVTTCCEAGLIREPGRPGRSSDGWGREAERIYSRFGLRPNTYPADKRPHDDCVRPSILCGRVFVCTRCRRCCRTVRISATIVPCFAKREFAADLRTQPGPTWYQLAKNAAKRNRLVDASRRSR